MFCDPQNAYVGACGALAQGVASWVRDDGDAYFNRLGKMFDMMPGPLQWLKHKMKKHLLYVAPANVAAKPIKKEKWTPPEANLLLYIFIAVHICLPSPMPTPSLLLPPKALSPPHIHIKVKCMRKLKIQCTIFIHIF